MAVFSYKGKQLWYCINNEKAGGLPLLILNGIMMSHLSWEPFMPALSSERPVVRMDFIDQGRSGAADAQYDYHYQADNVIALLDFLKIKNCHIFGISYGGQIALALGLKIPHRIQKLLVFHAAAYTPQRFIEIGESWLAAVKTGNAELFFSVSMPLIYSAHFYEKNTKWLQAKKAAFPAVCTPDFFSRMSRLIKTFDGFDIRNAIHTISCETLVVSAEYDALMDYKDIAFLAANIPSASHIHIPGAGHASMYETPDEFTAILKGFLGIEKIKIT